MKMIIKFMKIKLTLKGTNLMKFMGHFQKTNYKICWFQAHQRITNYLKRKAQIKKATPRRKRKS